MKRKFTLPGIELPKLISALRPDADSTRAAHDPFAHDLESQPPTPKSVRPPLPRDLNSELVAACRYVVTHPKPSHERWESSSSRPALDPAVIKQRYVKPRPEIPQRRKSSHSMNSINGLLLAPRADRKAEPSTIHHNPQLVSQRMEADDVTTQTAQSRADELMQSEPLRTVTALHIPRRASSRQHARSASAAVITATTRVDPTEQQKVMARSDSSCTARTGRTGRTAGSTPHTDSYPRSASTGMTSMTDTPARSKSTSSQAINMVPDVGSVPDSDDINGDMLRQEFQKHRRAASGKISGRHEADNALCKATYMPSVETYYADELALESLQLQQCHSRVRSRSTPRLFTANSTETSPEDHADAGASRTGRAGSRFRSESRTGANGRSASRAGTVASEIRSRYNDLPNVGRRMGSRASIVARSVKHYLRPSNSRASMRSLDYGVEPQDSARDITTADSHHSVHSPVDEPEERPRGRWAGLRRISRSSSRHLREDSLNRESESRRDPAASDAPTAKPPIDLNRELPPLPSLDQWTEQEDSHTTESVRSVSGSDQNNSESSPTFPNSPRSAPPHIGLAQPRGPAPELRHIHPLHRGLVQVPPMVGTVASPPPELLHIHPLYRGLPQVPPTGTVASNRDYPEATLNARAAIPVRRRKPVPTSAASRSEPWLSTSSRGPEAVRATGKRKPTQTSVTASTAGVDTLPVTPSAHQRTASRNMSIQSDNRLLYDRTRSESAKPRKYGIDEFKRRMQSAQKSELDLPHQQLQPWIRVEESDLPTSKLGWKGWAQKMKLRTTASYATTLNVRHRRQESSDSYGAAPAPVVR